MRRLAAVMIGATLLFAACGNDDGANVRTIDDDGSGSGTGSGSASGVVECEPVGDESAADRSVAVDLSEYVVDLDARTVAAGTIHFALDNTGDDAHELVIVRGGAPNDLPLDDKGALDEGELPAGALVGEVEAFPAGESCDGTFELAPGTYTLLCNLVETHDGETVAHLQKGMVTTLTVT